MPILTAHQASSISNSTYQEIRSFFFYYHSKKIYFFVYSEFISIVVALSIAHSLDWITRSQWETRNSKNGNKKKDLQGITRCIRREVNEELSQHAKSQELLERTLESKQSWTININASPVSQACDFLFLK